MANSIKLPKIRANDKALSLKPSTESQSRFHQYCMSSSTFPTPPPVPTLNAVERLKKFKAICQKKQGTSVNNLKTHKSSQLVTRKSVSKTLVKKKGGRKTLLLTPGKSPSVKLAKRRLLGKKLSKNKPVSLNDFKMSEVDTAQEGSCETTECGDVESNFGSENICDLKKKVLKKVFSSDDKIGDKEITVFGVKSSEEGERDDVDAHQSESNGSEIDVVSTTPHESTNGNGLSLNGNHVEDETQKNQDVVNENGHDTDNYQNGNFENGTTENGFEAQAEVGSAESNCDSLKDNKSSVSESIEFILNPAGGFSFSVNLKENGDNVSDSEEDCGFDAVLEAPVEANSSEENEVKMIPVADFRTQKVEPSQVPVSSEESSETKAQESVVIESEEQTVSLNENEASVLIVESVNAKKNSKTKKASSHVSAKPPTPKKPATPSKRTPSKKKVTGFEEKVRRSKRESSIISSKASSSAHSFDTWNQTIDLVSPETSCSSKVIPEEQTETPEVILSRDTDEESLPSTSTRRTRRAFSPSRRAPLRTSINRDLPVFESTPQNKRKAENVDDISSVKRLKNNNPRWSFFSSPITCYWSPKLSNKISTDQPESSLNSDPGLFSPKEQTSPESTETRESEKDTSENNSKWCSLM